MKNTKLIRIDKDGVRHYTDRTNSFCYPSITSVLSLTKPEKDREVLEKWKARVGPEKAQAIVIEACRHGTSVHALMEEKLTGTPPPVEILLKDRLVFRKGLRLIEPITDIKGIEIPLVSHELKVAGTSDGVVVWKDSLAIIDFKTMKKQKKDEWMKDYFIQMSFYAHAYQEMYQEPVRWIIIIGMPKDGPGFVSKQPVSSWNRKMVKRVNSYYQNLA